MSLEGLEFISDKHQFFFFFNSDPKSFCVQQGLAIISALVSREAECLPVYSQWDLATVQH